MAEVNLDGPAMTPPAGKMPNYTNPPTLMPAVIATAVVVLTLMTVCVAARAFVKIVILRKHYVEDWLCYWAWAGVVTYTGIFIYIADYGFARHQYDVSVAMFRHIMYYCNILYCVYSPTTLPAKLSVLFQIKRIFTTREKNIVYWVVWLSIIANIIVYTGLFFSYVFSCWPREAIWNSSVQGECISSVSSNFAAGILNFISDLEALLLPAWGIWHLNMPVQRKLAVFAVFGVGSIACAIGMIGIYFRVILLKTPDFTWLCTKAAILVISEMSTVVIVGCFPSLPRFYHYVRGSERTKQQSYDTPNSDERDHQKPGTFAKYIGPGVISSISNEHLELHSYTSEEPAHSMGEDGIRKTTHVEQSVLKGSA
ncbi:hypothetical protein M011DRAFT_410590 [Sporormia fimetaria CBS 119925]|uniref:Rhodopsin domain-containing protein n=1 Tax=Sporormia fimetaria CBS 119925 TaxID=1340428 RepID=A0A6A6V2B3_9PLEO|nr:hypothetical protein M011DRAFT_410590 [Sporormia fimetaria CBS 119925]